MDGHLKRLQRASFILFAAALGSILPAIASAQAPAIVARPHFVSASASISIVDAPIDRTAPMDGVRRPHPGLRMQSEMAQHAVRSLGLDATDCAMLLRVRSRMASTVSGNGSLVISPQMHLSCRF